MYYQYWHWSLEMLVLSLLEDSCVFPHGLETNPDYRMELLLEGGLQAYDSLDDSED